MKFIKITILNLLFFCLGNFSSPAQNNINSIAKKSHFSFPENIKSKDYLSSSVIVKVRPQLASIAASGNIANAAFNQLYNNVGGSGLIKKLENVIS